MKRLKKIDPIDAMVAVGGLCLSGGAALISIPAGLIVFGIFLIAAAVIISRADNGGT
jgi:uncharacterized membrane protein